MRPGQEDTLLGALASMRLVSEDRLLRQEYRPLGLEGRPLVLEHKLR